MGYEQGTIEDWASLQAWFEEHEDCFVVPYIEKYFGEVSFNYQYELMLKNLFFSKVVVENDQIDNDEKQRIFLRSMLKGSRPGKIVLVHGEMGGGKTGIGCWSIDCFHENLFDLLNYNTHKHMKYFFVTKAPHPPALPKWFNVVNSINKLEDGCFALIDEGAINLNSRRANTKENIEASQDLVKLRQRDMTLIVLVQHEKMVDVNVRRLASTHIYKQGSDMAHADNGGDQVDLIRQRLKSRDVDQCYVEISYKGGKDFKNFKHGLPAWWDDDKVSKYMANWKKESVVAVVAGKKKEINSPLDYIDTR